MNDRKVIFIGGSSYSGSTLLDMMLSSGVRGFSTGEAEALFHPYRNHHINPLCGCGNRNCKIWEELKNSGPKYFYIDIFNRFPRVSYIVDSSKNPVWIANNSKWLDKSGINVYHILIWKKPLEFAFSRLKRNKLKGWRKAWKNYHRLYFSLIDEWLSVKYSDLAKNPSDTIKNLCNLLEIDYFKDKFQFWKFDHHTLFGNARAKVHLYNEDTRIYKNYTREIKNMLSKQYYKKMNYKYYRNFYYEEEYISHIPTKDLNNTKNDKIISCVNDILESTDIKYGWKNIKNLETLSKLRYSYLLVKMYFLKNYFKNEFNKFKL